MSKTIVAVNAGPRKGWNTDTLITEAIRGAESAGAAVERFDLFRLERYTGCISCFGCKKEKNKGRCICRDYGKTDWPWTMFDAEDKLRRHEEVFPRERQKVFETSARLFR